MYYITEGIYTNFIPVLELVKSIKQGNETAFNAVFQQFRDKVFRYFMKKTESEEDARDLLQTTFLRLWQYRHSMNGDYTIDQHLFNIAKTVYIDFLRKKQVLVYPSVMPEQETPSPKQPAWDLERRLHQVLDTMPRARRQAFLLHKIQGYSHKEIAAEMNITAKAVENHIAKAVSALRKHLQHFSIIFFMAGGIFLSGSYYLLA
ncbi:sigma-70 family RNA polymerase sigma factor [Chitinophaga pollutisoli]|uniref:Sigma-70 family RNA polymerase sigma factor n=1 Tax=Chitinophaga pollutisoli TaxID=3133966 RepID=A0ABZ2YRA8_9BACT